MKSQMSKIEFFKDLLIKSSKKNKKEEEEKF